MADAESDSVPVYCFKPNYFGDTNYVVEKQRYEKLRLKFTNSRALFEDQMFRANNYSLFLSTQFKSEITWKRPFDLCSQPVFHLNGSSVWELSPGFNSDSNFLSTVQRLSMPHMKYSFNIVVPNDQSFDDSYTGMFHFRFWQYNAWVDIVIDDRLPVVKREDGCY